MRRFDFLSRWSGCTHADRGGQSCAVIDRRDPQGKATWWVRVSRLEGKAPLASGVPSSFPPPATIDSSRHHIHFLLFTAHAALSECSSSWHGLRNYTRFRHSAAPVMHILGRLGSLQQAITRNSSASHTPSITPSTPASKACGQV